MKINKYKMDEFSIEGYPNYTINRNGYVRNKKTGKILKPILNGMGYCGVVLYKDGKPKTLSIHRLIAIAFIPNPENKPCIDHINRIRTDNRIENIRWCSYKENRNNYPMFKNNTSGITGVYWYKTYQKWNVRKNGKNYGYFKSKDDAIAKAKEIYKSK
jgi:hypothetical protein